MTGNYNKYIIFIGFSLLCVSFGAVSYSLSGNPLKYISSCELDLNDDGKIDIVFLAETVRGRELIVLLKTTDGYDSFLVSTGKRNMDLSCHYGKTILETSAGKNERKRKVYKVLGAYILLSQPESSSVAYFWNKNKNGFQEVWTSD